MIRGDSSQLHRISALSMKDVLILHSADYFKRPKGQACISLSLRISFIFFNLSFCCLQPELIVYGDTLPTLPKLNAARLAVAPSPLLPNPRGYIPQADIRLHTNLSFFGTLAPL